MLVSVIIPTLNEADNITACLASITGQAAPWEIIVVDGGSADATVDLALRAGVHVINAPRGRAIQMNVGARFACGDVVLFLHADTRLHPAALVGLRAALADPAVVGGTFSLAFDLDHPLLRFYSLFTRLRPRLFHYGDQGIFARRDLFERLGGYQDLPLMEDVEFLRRLAHAGRLTLVDRPVTTSARRFERRGILRQELLNVWLVALYYAGVRATTLARWYR